MDRSLLYICIYKKKFQKASSQKLPGQIDKWASAWDFQQCGMCDQQSLRSACAFAQSDQSLC